MKFKLSDREQNILQRFRNSSYPSIYKTDNTDNILFVETVDFDVCNYLLKGKDITKNIYDNIMNSYQKFLRQVDLNHFDKYTLTHYRDIVSIMDIFSKYYNNQI